MGRKELSRNTLTRGHIVEYYPSGNDHWLPISVTLNTGITNIAVTYTKLGASSTTTTNFTSNGTITDAKMGSELSYEVTVGTAYNTVSTVTTTASNGLAISPTTTVKSYTLTISVTNSSYGTYSVSRTSSPYQGASTGTLSNGATIYYGDVLTGSASGNGTSYGSWNIISVATPSATTTGAATSGNLTIKNEDANTVTLYYNTSNATGGTSLGSTATGATKAVTGLNFNTTYYFSAARSRSRDKYVDALDGDQYSGTSGVTSNVTAIFKFKRTTTTDTGTIYSSVGSKKTAAQTSYTITFTRQRKDATAHQTLGSATADTSIGVASVTVLHGGSYSETFSKTNYVSQTKSGSNITANATVTVTLEPVTYTLSKSLTNWSGTWYTTNSYSTEIAWMYHGYTAYFKATPSDHYEQTISGTRYYHTGSYSKAYTTSVTNNNGSVTLSATAISYACRPTTVTGGTVFWSPTGGTYSTLSGTGSTYTISANTHYDLPSTPSALVKSFTYYSDASSSTATSSAPANCTYKKYTVSGTSSNGTVYWSTSNISSSGGSTLLSNISYGTTVYYRIDANTGYSRPSTYYGSLSLTDTNFTVSDTNLTATKTLPACTINSYAVTISATYCKATYLSTNSSATSGSPSGTSFNYNSTVYGFATLNDNTTEYTYTAPSGWTQISGRTYRVGLTTVTTSGGSISVSANRATNKYAVNIGATTYCKSAYLSTNSTATSGSASGTAFDYGATVYLFVTLNDDTTQYTYTAPSGWTNISGRIYRVTSLTVGTSNTFADVSATRTTNKYTVTFSASNGSWSTSSIANVPYGTSITRSGATVTVTGYGSSTYTKASTTVSQTAGDASYTVPASVAGATTVSASTAMSTRTYTIKWIGADGSTALETDTSVAYNATLTYNGSTPTKTQTDQYTYTFSAWKLGSTSGSTVVSGTTKNPGSTSSTTINIYSTFNSEERSYTVSFTAGTYGSWSTASITALYSAAISRSGDVVTVGTQTSTYSGYTATGYTTTVSYTNASGTVGTGKTITATTTRTANPYDITVTKNTGIANIYYKVNGASSFSTWTSGTISANYNTTVYWYATPETGYSSTGLGTSSSPNSFTMGTSGTIAPTTSRLSYTITFGTTSGKSLYGSWGSASLTAYYGDIISTSGTTVTCKKWDATSTNRWTNTVTAYSNTAQYTYGTPTVTGDTSVASVDANKAIAAWNTRTLNSYTITFTNPTYGAWGSTTKTAYYGDTLTVNGYTVTCAGNSSWTNTCSAAAQTDQYTYSLSGSVTVTSPVSGNQTVSGPSSSRTERSYNVTFSGTNGSWNNSITITATYSTGITVAGTSVTVGTNAARTWTGTDKNYYSKSASISPNASPTTVGTGKAYVGSCSYTPYNYTIQSTSVTGGTVYWSTSSITTSGGTTTLSAAYGSTAYWRIAASSGWKLPSTYYGSMTLNTDNFTISSTSATGNATYKGSSASVVIPACVRETLTVTINTGVSYITVYYRNTSNTYTSTTVYSSSSPRTIEIYPSSSWSWSATPQSNYTMNQSTGSGAGSGTISPTATYTPKLTAPSLYEDYPDPTADVRVTNNNSVAVTCYYGTYEGSTDYSTTISANSSTWVSSGISFGETYYFFFTASGYQNSDVSSIYVTPVCSSDSCSSDCSYCSYCSYSPSSLEPLSIAGTCDALEIYNPNDFTVEMAVDFSGGTNPSYLYYMSAHEMFIDRYNFGSYGGQSLYIETRHSGESVADWYYIEE